MIYYYGAFTQVKILDYIVSVLRSFQLLHAERRPLVHVLAGFLAHDRRHGREGPGRQVHRRRGKMVFLPRTLNVKTVLLLHPFCYNREPQMFSRTVYLWVEVIGYPNGLAVVSYMASFL